MKKTTALVLAFLMLLGLVAACGKPEQTKTPEQTEKTENGKEEYVSPQMEAVVAVAESYLARGKNLQYATERLLDKSIDDKITYRLIAGEYSPEDASSQFTTYTHCAAFTYDVYKEALGIEMNGFGVSKLMSFTDMHAFTYYIKGTESRELKDSILNQFKNSIQVGDILTCQYSDSSGGHAMLYVGDGWLIHSTWLSWEGGGAFNFAENKDRIEPNGTVERRALETIFQEDNYFYFWNQKCWALVRPMIKHPDALVTEETKNRMNNLLDVYVEKTSTHPGGKCADLGEEITYKFLLRNDGNLDKTLEILDCVPDGTEFVRGDMKVDGKKLNQTVTVKAGESKKISYTVKVENNKSLYDKGFVWYDKATVGGVTVAGRPVYIGKHLTADQEKLLQNAILNNKHDSKSLVLAEDLYKDIGMELTLVNASTVLGNCFTESLEHSGYYEINTDGSLTEMYVASLYGGQRVLNCDEMLYRTRGINTDELYVGDIIVSQRGNTRWNHMYAGDGKLFYLGTAKMYDQSETVDTLLAMIAKDEYIVLRPAAAK